MRSRRSRLNWPHCRPEAEPLGGIQSDFESLARSLAGNGSRLAVRIVEAVLAAVGIELEGDINPGLQPDEAWTRLAAAADHGPHFTSVAMAPRSTLNLHEGHESWAVGLEDLEAEQGHDLAVRLGAVAAALSLAPGGYEAARDTTTFPALVWYLAAVDVVLAYGTELDPVEEGTVEALIERHEEEIAAFLSASGSGSSTRDALSDLAAEVEEAVTALPDVVGVIAEAVRNTLPDIESSTEAFQQEARDTPVVGLLTMRVLAEVNGTMGAVAPATTDARSSAPEPEPDRSRASA